jgi:hypothetical protein
VVFKHIKKNVGQTLAVPGLSRSNWHDVHFGVFVVQGVENDFLAAVIAWRINDEKRNCRKN